MAENISNLNKKRDTVFQDVKTPGRMNPNRHILRYIIIQLWKVRNREKILEAGIKKDLSHTSERL